MSLQPDPIDRLRQAEKMLRTTPREICNGELVIVLPDASVTPIVELLREIIAEAEAYKFSASRS